MNSSCSDDIVTKKGLCPALADKIYTPEQWLLGNVVLPRPLVMTNGCFDILHVGHVHYLSQAKALGATLLVAVNSDASIQQLNKGDNRPINPLIYRLQMLAALAAVDAVCWFEDATPLSLIKQIRPDILVKGGDWPIAQMIGAQEVVAWGGKVYSLPFVIDISTTAIINKIRAS